VVIGASLKIVTPSKRGRDGRLLWERNEEIIGGALPFVNKNVAGTAIAVPRLRGVRENEFDGLFQDIL
jgi:hypothetical protein